MVSICLGQKEEELWEVHILHLAKIKRELSSRVHLTKASFSCVIGQLDQLTKLVARTTLLLLIGINKEVTDLS